MAVSKKDIERARRVQKKMGYDKKDYDRSGRKKSKDDRRDTSKDRFAYETRINKETGEEEQHKVNLSAREQYEKDRAAGRVTGSGKRIDSFRDKDDDRESGSTTKTNANQALLDRIAELEGAQKRREQERQREIEKQKQARIKSRVAGLDEARRKSLSAIGQEAERVPGAYEAARRREIVDEEMRRRQAEKTLRSIGATGGATAQAAQVTRGALQENLGELRTREAENIADIARRRTDIEKGYAADVESVKADAEAQALQRATEQERYDQQLALQKAGLTGYLGGERTLAGIESDARARAAALNEQAINQQLATGRINAEQAQYALDQMKDPNSPQNQAQQIELQIAQMNLDALPEMQRLQMEQLRKSVNNIGRTPTVSAVQREEQQLRLQLLRDQVEQSRRNLTETTQGFIDIGSVRQGIDTEISRLRPTNIDTLSGDRFVDPSEQRFTAARIIEEGLRNGTISEADARRLAAEYQITAGDAAKAERFLNEFSGR